MDYLLRDSYFSATSYGQFDLERILRTLRVREAEDGKKYLVIKETGIHSVEDYIMARYQMYWQVYFHPVARSYETIFIQLFKRLKDIYAENKKYFDDLKALIPFFIKKEVSEEEYFKLDESTILYYCNLIQEKDDSIAKDLAKRLQNRELFDYEDYSEKNLEKIKKNLEEEGFDLKYYLREENIEKSPYSPFDVQKNINRKKRWKFSSVRKS